MYVPLVQILNRLECLNKLVAFPLFDIRPSRRYLLVPLQFSVPLSTLCIKRVSARTKAGFLESLGYHPASFL